MFDRGEKAHLVFGWHHPIGWSSEQKGESRVSTSIHLLFPKHWYNVTICLMLLLTWLPIMLDYTLGLWVKVNLPNLCSFCQVFGHSDKSATNVVFFSAHPFFKKPITFTWHCESRRKGFRVKELFCLTKIMSHRGYPHWYQHILLGSGSLKNVWGKKEWGYFYIDTPCESIIK